MQFAAAKVIADNIKLDGGLNTDLIGSPASPLSEKGKQMMSFGSQGQKGYGIMLGDMKISIDPSMAVDTDRREPMYGSPNRNLHDAITEGKALLEKIAKKKVSTTHVSKAGGTGGGIRQNAKVVKSKNAVKLGVWSGHSGSPRRPNDVTSDLGQALS